VSFGNGAAIPDPLAWRMEWYDHWIKGEKNSCWENGSIQNKCKDFVMGSGDGHMTEDTSSLSRRVLEK
jgi:hypothetical protein